MAPSLGLEVSAINELDADNIEREVMDFAASPNGGLIVTASALSITHLEPAQGTDMQRHSGGRRPPKGRRKSRPKTCKAPTARASNANLQERVAVLTRALKEARDHQMATGEILASLTGTIPDAKPVFEAIVRNLQRLFDTRLAVVQVLKDGMVHLAAAGREEYEILAKRFPRALDDNTGGSRAIISKRVVQFVPVLGNPAAPAATQQFARHIGFNSAIFAPNDAGQSGHRVDFNGAPWVETVR